MPALTIGTSANDGGAWATTNRGDTWNSLNLDLHTLEFFSAAADSADSGSYAGGMQDNGPALTGGNPAWVQLATGDGAYVVADPRDSGAFFMSRQWGDIFHVRLSTPGNPKSVIRLSDLNPVSDFLTPFELLPTDPRLYTNVGFQGFDFKPSRILLAGATGGRNTVAVQLTCAINSIIHYIAPVPGDPTTAYLTAGSALYRLSNISFAGNATVTPITGDPINGDVLGHLAVSRAGILYLTKVGFVEGQKIFSSADGGNNWTNISGNLPNTPLHWVTVDPVDQNFIFVAGDTGVYVATDGGVEGEEWRRLGSGLPNVPVMQTQISPTRKLVAATYGRGVWTLDISNLTGVTGDPVLIQSSWGDQGNFELLVPQGEMIRHYFRNNDEPTPSWHFLREFGYPRGTHPAFGPTPRSVTFIQSNYKGDGVHGNFEAIVRVSPPIEPEADSLDFWFFDSGQLRWHGPFPLVADGQPVTGVTGDPVLIQSSWGDQGNFELLVPQGEVIRRYVRTNDEPAPSWHFLREFGYPTPPTQLGRKPRGVTFIQSNYLGDGVHGNFEAIARVAPPIAIEPDTLHFWFFDSGQLEWHGPFLLC